MRIAKGRNFPHARRGLRLLYGEGPSAAATPHAAGPPLVLAGCFRGLPEQAYFAQLIETGARFACLGRRSDVLLAATLLQPRLVVLPSADVAGVSTWSIVKRCLSLAPAGQMSVLVLLSLAAGVRRAPRAIAAPGVEVAAVRDTAELAGVISALLRTPEPKSSLRLA